MSLGDWSKEEAGTCRELVDQMFLALPKSKRMEYIGHLNQVLIFLSEAAKHAPGEA